MPEYFVYKREGPYGISTLSQQVQNGEVDNYSFVWTPGMASLEYAKKMPELRPWFEEQELEHKKVRFDAVKAKSIPSSKSGTAPAATPSSAVTPSASATPSAAVTPSAADYKVAVNGQSTGPFSLEQLTDKIQSHEVSPQTLVWKPGMPQWVAAQSVEDLAKVFEAVPATEEQQEFIPAEEEQQEFVPVDAEQPVTLDASAEIADAAAESADDFFPTDASFDGGFPYQSPNGSADADDDSSDQPSSLLPEDADDVLPWKKFIPPGVLVLLGGAVTFLALKTAVLAGPLAKLAALLVKKPAVAGGQLNGVLPEGAPAAVPLLIKLIPGGLFALAAIVLVVITLLSQRSSEQSEPEQL